MFLCIDLFIQNLGFSPLGVKVKILSCGNRQDALGVFAVLRGLSF
jgi:hypothetical protein